MSTNAQCGFDGSIDTGTEVVEWTLNLLEDVPEATSMDSGGYKEYIPCLKSAEGTFTTLVASGTIGTRTNANFNNDIHGYTLDIIVTNCAVGTPVDGRVTYVYTWISTGPVVIS